MFAITIYEMLIKIKNQCPDLKLNVWFYDDSNLCGKLGDVLKAYEIIKAMGPELGFYPTDRKSILWWPKMDDISPRDDESYRRRYRRHEVANRKSRILRNVRHEESP